MKEEKNLVVPPSGDPQEPEKSTIKEYLDSNKLSLKWLAAQLGLSDGTIKNWFYSSTKISDTNLHKINEVIKDHGKGLIDSSFWDQRNYVIVPENKDEWEAWKKEADASNFNSALDWARSILNQEVEKSKNTLSTDDKKYSNPIIFPIEKNSRELWEVIYSYDKLIKKVDGTYSYEKGSNIGVLLNSRAKEEIQKAINQDNKFSLKKSVRANLDFLTEKIFKNNSKVFIFNSSDVVLWSIAAKLAGFETLNQWANVIIDEYVEWSLLARMGINTPSGYEDDDIPF